MIGTGRIDTLAFDANNSCPVFVEYKRRGEFGEHALIQLMDYLSWFARDENRMAVLEMIIRKRKPDIEDFERSIRLICVVTDIDDRVRNAIYALANRVQVFSYMVALDTGNNVVLVPELEVDNAEIESQVPEVASEAELLKKYPHLQETFNTLRSHLERDGASGYIRGRHFRFKKDRVFGIVYFRREHIRLDLRVGRGKVADPDFRYGKQGQSNWGSTSLYPAKPIPEKIIDWIGIARTFTRESEEDGEGGAQP